MHRFATELDHTSFRVDSYGGSRMYCCSEGIVVMRTGIRMYGATERKRSDGDFALHPVPFWDHEQIRKYLRPHLSFVSGLVDVILSYFPTPSLDSEPITSHLRYIQSNALALYDGLEGFVVMASYWDKQQIEKMETLSKGNTVGINTSGSERDKSEGDQRILVVKARWDELIEHQHAPSDVSDGDPSTFTALSDKGTWLHLAHQLYDK